MIKLFMRRGVTEGSFAGAQTTQESTQQKALPSKKQGFWPDKA